MKDQAKKYGIGIVGCGTISGTHAEAIRGSKKAKLIAAYSRTKSSINTFCEEYGVKGFTDYQHFLSCPDLDIVVICTPTGTHLDYGIEAANAGKSLIVEKPIEINLGRGKDLISICRENNVQLAVIYQSRFISDVIRMKKVVDYRVLGKIFMVDVSMKWYRSQDYYNKGNWKGTLALDGGGAVINQAIHTIDLMVWFFGKPESLYAYKGTYTHEGIEGEDNAIAAMRFKNGAVGLFCASTSIVPPSNRKFEIHGKKGTAVLNGDWLELKLDGKQTDEGKMKTGSGSSSPLEGMTSNHHQKQYEQVLDAFNKGKKPIVSGEESLESLAVVEAIYESSEMGEEIWLDDFLARK